MNKSEAIKVIKNATGKDPMSIVDLNSRYFVLSVGGLLYSVDKRNGDVGGYNPLLDAANFDRAICSGKYEEL